MKPAAAEQPGLSLGPAFAASLGLLRKRPLVLPALGAAIVLSLSSVCCGIGLFTTPWFSCELFAAQLALCTKQPLAHRRAWLPAGMIMLGAVLLVIGVAALTLLGAGPDLPPGGAQRTSLAALMRSGGFYAAISGMIALLVLVPVLYAPLVLLERGGGFEEALLESVRVVARRGWLQSFGLSLAAHALQFSPLLAAAGWALAGGGSLGPVPLLLAAPLLCVSLPLGQGMIIWTYARSRPESEPAAGLDAGSGAAHSAGAPGSPVLPRTASGPMRHTALGERAPAAPLPVAAAPHTALALASISRWIRRWTLAVALAIWALLGVGLSALIRPSALAAGKAPEGELVCELLPEPGRLKRAPFANTSLELSASQKQLSVAAVDGGGTGSLALREAEPISAVRVVRVRDTFAIEVRQGGSSSLTWVDRAGVRLDDDLRARLLDRVSPRELAFLLLFPCLATLLSVPVLHRLARVQLAYRKFGDRLPRDEVLELALLRSLRRTRLFVGLLLPLDLLAVWLAVRALLLG